MDSKLMKLVGSYQFVQCEKHKDYQVNFICTDKNCSITKQLEPMCGQCQEERLHNRYGHTVKTIKPIFEIIATKLELIKNQNNDHFKQMSDNLLQISKNFKDLSELCSKVSNSVTEIAKQYQQEDRHSQNLVKFIKDFEEVLSQKQDKLLKDSISKIRGFIKLSEDDKVIINDDFESEIKHKLNIYQNVLTDCYQVIKKELDSIMNLDFQKNQTLIMLPSKIVQLFPKQYIRSNKNYLIEKGSSSQIFIQEQENQEQNVGQTNTKLAQKTVYINLLKSDQHEIMQFFWRLQLELNNWITLNKLNSPYINQLKGFSIDMNQKGVVSCAFYSSLKKESLEFFIKEKKNTNLYKNLKILIQISELLVLFKHRDIAHGNLKPSEILLDENGNISVTDFQTAQIQGQQVCLEGEFSLVPRYASPEMLNMVKEIDIKYWMDVWAFGCIAYELMTGLQPWFEIQDLQQLIEYIRKSKDSLIDHLNKFERNKQVQIDQRIQEIILLCTNKNFKQRIEPEDLLNKLKILIQQ